MEKIKVALDIGAYIPTRAHDLDAGLDLYAKEDVAIWPNDTEITDTGVHVEIPEGFAGVLISKSGLNSEGITTTGLIDAGYTGSVKVVLINNGPIRRLIKKGDKITQLVIIHVETPAVEIVDKIDGGSRGNNGFGSSGR